MASCSSSDLPPSSSSTAPGAVVRLEYSDGVILLSGSLTAHSIGEAEQAGSRVVRGAVDLVDGSGLEKIDMSGAVFVRRIAGGSARLRGFSPKAERLLELCSPGTGAQPGGTARTARRRFDMEALGDSVLKAWASLVEIAVLVVDLVYWAAVGIFDRSQYRKGDFSEQAFRMGSTALPIVGTIMFLIGAISVLQSAATLRSFGASIFVVDMLALGLARELAPLMTAIIVSGRSGSAIASEIATMKFTEELDAIRTMGLNPIRFVVAPKLWAMAVCLPLLSIMALAFGILGGFVVAVTYVDISPVTFFNRLLVSLFTRDIVTGLVKCVSFAIIITVVGVHRGLGFRGGADGVGRATTSSVVTAIFAIIVVNSIWGLIFYFRT